MSLIKTTTSGGGKIYFDSKNKEKIFSETIEVPNKVIYVNLIESYKKYNRNVKLKLFIFTFCPFVILSNLLTSIIVFIIVFVVYSLFKYQPTASWLEIFYTILIVINIFQSIYFFLLLDKNKINYYLPICFKNESIKLDENNEQLISIEIDGKRKNVEYVQQTLKDCSDIDFIDSKLKIQNPWKNFKYFNLKKTIK